MELHSFLFLIGGTDTKTRFHQPCINPNLFYSQTQPRLPYQQRLAEKVDRILCLALQVWMVLNDCRDVFQNNLLFPEQINPLREME